MNKSEIILYKTQNSDIIIDVLVDNETVWLNRQQMAFLFDRDIKTIGKHINNALKEELSVNSTIADFETVQNSIVAKFATTAIDGKIYQIEYYNPDMIISVGYPSIKGKAAILLYCCLNLDFHRIRIINMMLILVITRIILKSRFRRIML
jgi:hypothetical protein